MRAPSDSRGPEPLRSWLRGGEILARNLAKWTSSVFDPRASASSSHTAKAMDRREMTAGDRCNKTSKIPSSMAVKRGCADPTLTSRVTLSRVTSATLMTTGLHSLSSAL